MSPGTKHQHDRFAGAIQALLTSKRGNQVLNRCLSPANIERNN
jgi:hypothetical protein